MTRRNEEEERQKLLLHSMSLQKARGKEETMQHQRMHKLRSEGRSVQKAWG